MKACKIILIIFLVIKSIAAFIQAFVNDDEYQFENAAAAVIGIPVAWLLYAGAGILDL